jgi:hypothetical protein
MDERGRQLSGWTNKLTVVGGNSAGETLVLRIRVAQASRLCTGNNTIDMAVGGGNSTSEMLALRIRVAQASRLCTDVEDQAMAKEQFTRRNLPHWYMPSATHFVTFRLAGTLPQLVLADLRDRKERLLAHKRDACAMTVSHREWVHKQLFAAYDEYLDRHQQIHWMDDPQVAAMVRRSLHFWNGRKYGLCAYCILPNHVHLLISPFNVEPANELQRESLEPGRARRVQSALGHHA